MSRIKSNSISETVLFEHAEKLLAGEYCDPRDVIKLQTALLSSEDTSDKLRSFVFNNWRQVESGFLSAEYSTGYMPHGLDQLAAFDRFFLRPLATRVSESDLRLFAEVGLKHLSWLSHVGPLSDEHVQLARHAANLLKWSIGKFLLPHGQDTKLAERLTIGLNGLLAWVSAPPHDPNGAVRSFQAVMPQRKMEIRL